LTLNKHLHIFPDTTELTYTSQTGNKLTPFQKHIAQRGLFVLGSSSTALLHRTRGMAGMKGTREKECATNHQWDTWKRSIRPR